MPIDNFFIKGLSDELNGKLKNARIDKIYMPKRDQVLFNLRTENGNAKLMISVGAYPAVWLTEQKFENPDVPPMFCMMLRKHIGNGRILSVTQPGRERIISITVSSTSEMGDISEKKLICELMGRQKNIILVNHKGIITACLRNVGLENGGRGVLPGLAYTLPQADDKPYLSDLTVEELKTIVESVPDDEPEKFVCKHVSGMTLALARVGLKQNAPWEWFYSVGQSMPKPYIITENNEPTDICAYKPDGDSILFSSFCEALDGFYGKKASSDSLSSVKRDTEKTLQNALKRTRKKVAEQKIELETAQNREKIKEKADLITANIGMIKPGCRIVRVINYYDESMPEIGIELDPMFSPQQNAQRLYKKYARLKSAEIHLMQQIEKGEAEIGYIESLLYQLKTAENTKEAEAAKAEAREAGFIKRDKKKEKKLPLSSPRKLTVSSGLTVLCGRNNRENDELTHRIASKKDIWFHARGIAGSHVVLICDGIEPTEQDIMETAAIAAYYCASSGGVAVPVDYTQIKNVKKPAGGRPGAVNYFEYKSVLVKPQLPKGDIQ